MIRKNFQFDDEVDTKEGRHFIYKAVEFFMFRTIEKVKKSKFRLIEEDYAKKLYEKYLFIYNRSSDPDMELCHLLIQVASDYIDFVEDGFSNKFSFPFDYDVLFDLEEWFNEIDTKNLYTEEIMLLLINKLYYSPVYHPLLLV